MMTQLMIGSKQPTHLIDMNAGKTTTSYYDTNMEVSQIDTNANTDIGLSCKDSLFEFSSSDMKLYELAGQSESIDTGNDTEILAKSYLVNWDTITWHRSFTLDRLA